MYLYQYLRYIGKVSYPELNFITVSVFALTISITPSAFYPDLKLISFTNPFIDLSAYIGTAVTDLGLQDKTRQILFHKRTIRPLTLQ